MKKLFICILLSNAFLSLKAQHYFVQRDSLYAAMPGFSKAVAQFDSLAKSYNDLYAKQETDFGNRFNDFLKPYNFSGKETMAGLRAKMKATDTLQLNLFLQENTLLQDKKKLYQQTLQGVYNSSIVPYTEKLNNVLANYALTNKIDCIWDAQNLLPSVLYIKKEYNITATIRKLLEKM